ncbi:MULTISPECIES: hypothetical protein [Lysinibacillus]|uniref:hypothetical protein n=1 Tax=Lysinibacillus TaxID=400634 RepID=UPI0018CD5856|nr:MULTISPECIES: hypothetical protein [Lysinibacillus]MBG9756152.1 hypothetical protein [Lysinibacillus sphaericus]MBI6865890.1 hypothetical protein [Lysinibacillus fusiformis]QTB11817.1 hypothetical protein J2B92_12820 [Lysinibacillus sphaericus]
MQRVIHLIIISLVGIYFVYGLSSIFLNTQGNTAADFIILAILLVLVALFEGFLIQLYRRKYSAKAIKARKEREANRKREQFDAESKVLGSRARQHLFNADLCIKVKHTAGLPIAEGAETFVYRCTDKVIFERGQDTIELDINKVTDILIKTDVEIQKSWVSNAGRAIAGDNIFGSLGAIIGGLEKEKTSTVIEKYLIFAYEMNGGQKYISFEVTKEPNANLFNSNYYNLSHNERRFTSL